MVDGDDEYDDKGCGDDGYDGLNGDNGWVVIWIMVG